MASDPILWASQFLCYQLALLHLIGNKEPPYKVKELPPRMAACGDNIM